MICGEVQAVRKRLSWHWQLNVMSIEQQPERVNCCAVFGYWENRYAHGTYKVFSGFSDAERVHDLLSAYSKDSELQLRALYGERFSNVFRLIISDNNSEFAALPEQLPKTSIIMRIRT